MGASNAQLQRDTHVEIVSLALFNKARVDGAVATRKWIGAQLARLQSHPDNCHCSEPCQLARQVPVGRVYWTTNTWQRSIRATAVLARR
jgi:hypothetical protein